ncbi:hypothetical protein N7532_000196 [Penicillium argentinense]|uniref:Uncharacterized protein n=1 Tax=Penicillium argentinense TaxID=1131581 RepID=A0A9W9G4T2_9EURO|nr:uncharacterized protein N7532_000196 [Penicillium argentinense]KAJ5112151.1 hypothetical protein N7532_000196 [Penicillium argentinense]
MRRRLDLLPSHGSRLARGAVFRESSEQDVELAPQSFSLADLFKRPVSVAFAFTFSVLDII